MTQTDHDEWRRLAEAVESPSPWHASVEEDSPRPAVYSSEGVYVCQFQHTAYEAEAAYIAHSSPDRVLALLEENAKLRRLLDGFRSSWGENRP